MKIIARIIFGLLLVSGSVQGQVKHLWAMGSDGAAGYGTILKADSNGTNFQLAASFNYVNGSYPQAKLLMAGNGKIYGVTRRGGVSNSCVIFMFDTATNVITKIYDFMSATQFGAIPYSGMIQGDDCLLYGMTWDGGANSKGVIYSLDPSNNQYTDIYDFVVATGCSPFGDLLQLSNGKFYGIGTQGGANNKGVIFSFDPVTLNYTLEHDFAFATGWGPAYGSLILAGNGLLYGHTIDGGTFANGVLFSFDPVSGTYNNVHSFGDVSDGRKPFGSPMQASDGKLYGMTLIGGTNNKGAMYSYDIASGTYTVLVDFNGVNGEKPQRGLTQVSNGKLFGTTMYGGTSNHGVIFHYDIPAASLTKVFDFDSVTTGAHPTCDVFESGALFNPCALLVPEISSSETWSVYPNPVADFISINASAFLNIQKIIIVDCTGRIIMNQVPVEMNSGAIQIPVDNLERGTYFIKISDPSGFTHSKRFIKM